MIVYYIQIFYNYQSTSQNEKFISFSYKLIGTVVEIDYIETKSGCVSGSEYHFI